MLFFVRLYSQYLLECLVTTTSFCLRCQFTSCTLQPDKTITNHTQTHPHTNQLPSLGRSINEIHSTTGYHHIDLNCQHFICTALAKDHYKPLNSHTLITNTLKTHTYTTDEQELKNRSDKSQHQLPTLITCNYHPAKAAPNPDTHNHNLSNNHTHHQNGFPTTTNHHHNPPKHNPNQHHKATHNFTNLSDLQQPNLRRDSLHTHNLNLRSSELQWFSGGVDDYET